MSGMAMEVFRSVKNREHPYARISAKTIDDKSLTPTAFRILSYLLNRPKDWVLNIHDLCNKLCLGRSAVYNGLKVLRRLGYLLCKAVRNRKGQYSKWVYIVYEEANFVAAKFFVEQNKRKSDKSDNSMSADATSDLFSDETFIKNEIETLKQKLVEKEQELTENVDLDAHADVDADVDVDIDVDVDADANQYLNQTSQHDSSESKLTVKHPITPPKVALSREQELEELLQKKEVELVILRKRHELIEQRQQEQQQRQPLPEPSQNRHYGSRTSQPQSIGAVLGNFMEKAMSEMTEPTPAKQVTEKHHQSTPKKPNVDLSHLNLIYHEELEPYRDAMEPKLAEIEENAQDVLDAIATAIENKNPIANMFGYFQAIVRSVKQNRFVKTKVIEDYQLKRQMAQASQSDQMVAGTSVDNSNVEMAITSESSKTAKKATKTKTKTKKSAISKESPEPIEAGTFAEKEEVLHSPYPDAPAQLARYIESKLERPLGFAKFDEEFRCISEERRKVLEEQRALLRLQFHIAIFNSLSGDEQPEQIKILHYYAHHTPEKVSTPATAQERIDRCPICDSKGYYRIFDTKSMSDRRVLCCHYPKQILEDKNRKNWLFYADLVQRIQQKCNRDSVGLEDIQFYLTNEMVLEEDMFLTMDEILEKYRVPKPIPRRFR